MKDRPQKPNALQAHCVYIQHFRKAGQSSQTISRSIDWTAGLTPDSGKQNPSREKPEARALTLEVAACVEHIRGQRYLKGALHLLRQRVIDVPWLQGTQSMQGQLAQSAAEHILKGALHLPRQRAVDVLLLQQE